MPAAAATPRRSISGKSVTASPHAEVLAPVACATGIEEFAMSAPPVSNRSVRLRLATRARSSEDFVDASEVAAILGISKPTLLSDRCRAPQKVPPCYRIPGRRGLLWLRHEVVAWVQEFPEARNAFLEGRPARARASRRPKPRSRLKRTSGQQDSHNCEPRSD